MNIFEGEDMSTFLKLRTKEKEEPVDSDKENKIKKYREEKNKKCPRCGNSEGICKCEEKDFYSTINSYRIPKGIEIKKENIYTETYQMKHLKLYEQFIQDIKSI